MKKNMMMYLLTIMLATIPLLVRAEISSEQNIQQKGPWSFYNFGKTAKGEVSIANNKMSVWTQNTKSCFNEADEYSFIYQKQPFPYDDCSQSTISVVVEQFSMGSSGIMMRSSDRMDAPNAHLEVTSTGDLFLFFRRTSGAFTMYRRVGKVSFPAEIKLFRQGDTFISYYKNADKKWVKGPIATVDIGTDPLVGFYACSGSDSQIGYDIDNKEKMEVSFRNWDVNYEENYIPAEQDFIDNTPVKTGTLLRDNFADGSLVNEPASMINPIWEGIKYAELPIDQNGKRYWKKWGDGTYFVGNKKWADYEVNLNFSFDENIPATSEFMLQVRYQHISVYEKLLRYYGISFRNGNKLYFEKFEAANGIVFSKEATIPTYTDGSRHQLRVKFLDKDYELYLDNTLIIKGVDESHPITYGRIALKFTDTQMNIYQVEVLEVEDPINGNTDNYLLDYYDTPIPAYLKKYGYE